MGGVQSWKVSGRFSAVADGIFQGGRRQSGKHRACEAVSRRPFEKQNQESKR